MMSWIMVYYDALKEYRLLSDEQFGRLIRAALSFAQDGTEPTFDGPEAYLWPGLENRLIRDKESYAEKCRQNAENIRKRWNRDGKHAETEGEPPPGEYGRIRPNTNVYESYEEKEEVKEEVEKESKIKVESESEINAREKLRAEGYSEAEIDQAFSRIPKGRTIRNLAAYIKKAIEEERNGKRVPAQEYQQRSYDGEQEKAMARMIAGMKDAEQGEAGT